MGWASGSKHRAFWLVGNQPVRETAIMVLHELPHLAYRRGGQPIADIGTTACDDEEATCQQWARQQVADLT